MLWSLCTSTFIPFFNVFDATGNSWALAGIAARHHAHNTSTAVLRNQIVFMDPPSCRFLLLRRKNSANVRRKSAESGQERENPYRAARTTLQLDRSHHQECARFRQFAQVGEIFKMIQTRSQCQAVHGKISRCAVIDAERVAAQSAHL